MALGTRDHPEVGRELVLGVVAAEEAPVPLEEGDEDVLDEVVHVALSGLEAAPAEDPPHDRRDETRVALDEEVPRAELGIEERLDERRIIHGGRASWGTDSTRPIARSHSSARSVSSS